LIASITSSEDGGILLPLGEEKPVVPAQTNDKRGIPNLSLSFKDID
jgi:hypothetical protein